VFQDVKIVSVERVLDSVDSIMRGEEEEVGKQQAHHER
jgi:hypothetical protein